jgi:hypothetical protein
MRLRIPFVAYAPERLSMPVQRLLHTCLWLFAIVSGLSGCLPGISASTTVFSPIEPHGCQYYSIRDAKYLGSDGADSLTYRLIDSLTFKEITRTWSGEKEIWALHDSSYPITVNDQAIQSDLQWVKDCSESNKREYQMYIFIDRTSGQISSLRGEPGDNKNSYPEVKSCPEAGVLYTVLDHHPQINRILIGQVHGHPASTNEGERTIPQMSPKDSITAICLQAPVYAIDAMDDRKEAFIHRSNPNPGPTIPGQSLCIGKTSTHFDIGLNALTIWGLTQRPDFNRIYKIDADLKHETARRSTASLRH